MHSKIISAWKLSINPYRTCCTVQKHENLLNQTFIHSRSGVSPEEAWQMKDILVICSQIFQLKELDSDNIFCIVGSFGELGSGASAVVRLAVQDALDYVAVKCFIVNGGDQDKRRIAKKYVALMYFKINVNWNMKLITELIERTDNISSRIKTLVFLRMAFTLCQFS